MLSKVELRKFEHRNRKSDNVPQTRGHGNPCEDVRAGCCKICQIFFREEKELIR